MPYGNNNFGACTFPFCSLHISPSLSSLPAHLRLPLVNTLWFSKHDERTRKIPKWNSSFDKRVTALPPSRFSDVTFSNPLYGSVPNLRRVSRRIRSCTIAGIPCSRYLAITQPLIYSRRRRSKRLAGLMIVAVWVMAGAITSPPLLGCFPRATNRDIKKCSYNMDSSYVIFSAMGSFFLPMLVMLYVYGRISCVIAGRHRNLEATEAENVRPRRRITVRENGFDSGFVPIFSHRDSPVTLPKTRSRIIIMSIACLRCLVYFFLKRYFLFEFSYFGYLSCQ